MTSTTEADVEVMLVGYGLEYLLMACNAARSLQATNPDLRRVLVTNVPVDPEVLAGRFDRVVVRDEPAARNRFVKTSILDHASADRVMYVDADAEVVGDLTPAFALLDRFDVVLRMHATPVNKPFELADGIPGGVFPHLHGGVFWLSDGDAARGFLATWQRRMVESGLDRDQPALARTVYDLPELRALVLNSVWSADPFEAATLHRPGREAPRILHYGKPHHALDVAHRLRAELEPLLPLLPADVRASEAAQRVQEKYRRLTSPLFRTALTRRAYLSFAHRTARLRGRPDVDVMDRGAVAEGRAYQRDAGRLWAD